MQLSEFRSLISQMPIRYQAFRSNRSTWERYNNHEAIRSAIETLFENKPDVFLSRGQLFTLAQSENLAAFILATIIWGYSSGMRGNHFKNLLAHFPTLIDLLQEAKDSGIQDWAAHYRHVEAINGLGLSTHTKLLYFLGVQVAGLSALILDERIIEVARRGIFADLASLQSMTTRQHAEKRYPKYLSVMHDLAAKLEVSADCLEFFLFEYGLALKPPN